MAIQLVFYEIKFYFVTIFCSKKAKISFGAYVVARCAFCRTQKVSQYVVHS